MSEIEKIKKEIEKEVIFQKEIIRYLSRKAGACSKFIEALTGQTRLCPIVIACSNCESKNECDFYLTSDIGFVYEGENERENHLLIYHNWVFMKVLLSLLRD